jgi:hypothetical protein
MPRDGSGNYTRVVPPGASGYVNNTTIDETQVNGEINDIGNELTNSLTASGTKTPTANLPMGNFLHSGLGQATAAGQTVRFNALQQGSDIAVSASGSITIPAEGALFNLTAASAFNITGFSSAYNGRAFGVRFNPDKLLKLVNSSTFKLIGGTDRITASGEIAYFMRESGGSYTEVGMQPVLDLTSYSGADIQLAIGQTAKYSVSAASSLLLRLACNDGQAFELNLTSVSVAGSATAATTVLNPNNTTFSTSFTFLASVCNVNTGAVVGSNGVLGNILLAGANTVRTVNAKIFTNTNGKSATVLTSYSSNTATFVAEIISVCTDTTTVWNSLGTISFGALTFTGTVMVKRLV